MVLGMYNTPCKFSLEDGRESIIRSTFLLTVGSMGVELGCINLSDLKVDIVMLEN